MGAGRTPSTVGGDDDRVLIVVVTGPPGAGKSTAATLAHDALGDAGVANALIEIDELERCYPPLPPGRVWSHAAALLASYVEVGHRLVLVTATLEDDEDRLALWAATGDAERLLVRLEVPPEVARARVLAREPEGWAGLAELLDAAGRLAVAMRGLPGVDLVVDSGTEAADAVASRIVAAVGRRRSSRR